MPEHVHLLASEPDHGTLADAMRDLKLSFSKRVPRQRQGSFWQKRYYDRNVRNEREFGVKLRYIHRNPVKRGLAREPGDWEWSSFRHYALREKGVVEIESEWTREIGKPRHLAALHEYFFTPGETRKQRSRHLGHPARNDGRSADLATQSPGVAKSPQCV
jgi:Transposase IS200 like